MMSLSSALPDHRQLVPTDRLPQRKLSSLVSPSTHTYFRHSLPTGKVSCISLCISNFLLAPSCTKPWLLSTLGSLNFALCIIPRGGPSYLTCYLSLFLSHRSRPPPAATVPAMPSSASGSTTLPTGTGSPYSLKND